MAWWDASRVDAIEKQVCMLVECPICFELMHEPVTTICGHSFCRACLVPAMRKAMRCPSCRTSLVGMREPATNATLQRVVQQLAPSRSAARARDAVKTKPLVEQLLNIFVLEPVLPRQRLKLHVFEPRYRRLVATALDSEKRFGIAGWVGRHMADVVTECEILDHAALPDGRYLCEVVGRSRYRVLRDWESDAGYRVAAVTPCRDDPVDRDDPTSDRLRQTAVDAAAQVGVWCDNVRIGGWERIRGQLDTILTDLGPMPPLHDYEALGLWCAALLNPLPALGVAPEIRLDVLTHTSSLDRLVTVLAAFQASNDYVKANRLSPLRRIVLRGLAYPARLLVLICARIIAAPLAVLIRFCGPIFRLQMPLAPLQLPLEGVGQ